MKARRKKITERKENKTKPNGMHTAKKTNSKKVSRKYTDKINWSKIDKKYIVGMKTKKYWKERKQEAKWNVDS